MENVIKFAHNIVKDHITKDSLVIDATVGNGYDTVFLAKHAKHVFGFDIQQEAITETTKKCKGAGVSNVTLFLASHELMEDYVNQTIDAVMYNLGYLPRGDKSITTKASSTIASIKSALSILSKNGIITITIYIGHEEGKVEETHLEHFLKKLNPTLYTVVRYAHINKVAAPYTVCIEKK